MNDDSTLGELQDLMARERVMRMQVSQAKNGVVVLLVWEDGTTALSSGHATVGAAIAETLARKKDEWANGGHPAFCACGRCDGSGDPIGKVKTLGVLRVDEEKGK